MNNQDRNAMLDLVADLAESQLKTKQPSESKSASKVLAVLDVLLRNFAYGFSPSELVKETGFSGSDITRYVQTLELAGYAERIAETNRIRPSHKLALKAMQIIRSLEHAHAKISESRALLHQSTRQETIATGDVFNELFGFKK
jgi:DNA-binding IclR family transcriptional regulator